jgi:spoIIIJ-associated protein
MEINDFLSGLLAHMGIESSTIEVAETDDAVVVSLRCEESESGLLIGRHAETLDAMQHILRLLYQKEYEKPLVLNINDFRESREQYITELATRMAERVIETGHPQSLHLPAHERRLVHMALAEHEKVTTLSEGEGAYRVLKIVLKDTV